MKIVLLLSTSYLAVYSFVIATFLLNLRFAESKCISGVFEKYPGACPNILPLCVHLFLPPLSCFPSLSLCVSIIISLCVCFPLSIPISLSFTFFLSPFLSCLSFFIYDYLKLYFSRHLPSYVILTLFVFLSMSFSLFLSFSLYLITYLSIHSTTHPSIYYSIPLFSWSYTIYPFSSLFLSLLMYLSFLLSSFIQFLAYFHIHILSHFFRMYVW